MPTPPPPPSGSSALPQGTFAGQVVLVTGGGTGIGRGIAVEFARLGASVAILSRKQEHREAGVAAVIEAGGPSIGVACDIRHPEQITQAFDEIEVALGPVSVLINNAAGNFAVAAEAISPNAWRAVTQIVLDGTFFMSTEFGRRRLARNEEGAIVNIAATYAWTGGPGASHSAAAKAGVVSLTQSLAVEWASDGIRVNAIAPGVFPHRDQDAHWGEGREDATRARVVHVPAGRVGEVRELGWAATFLCSPYARYINRPHACRRRRQLAAPLRLRHRAVHATTRHHCGAAKSGDRDHTCCHWRGDRWRVVSGLVLQNFDDGVTTITLNRPERHNAMNDEMSHAFRALYSAALEDPRVRCVVLRANGPSFSSGRDTTQLGQRELGDTDWEFVRRHQLIRTQKIESPKPVIAAVKGYTFGGVFELALSADIRVSDTTLQACLPEVRYAIAVDTGASALVTALAGPSKAKYLLMTGDRIDAATALAWGLVDFVVEPDQLDAKTSAIAERIASHAPLAVQMSKSLVDNVWAGMMHSALRAELLAQTALFQSRDRAEHGAARREGREPRYEGR